MAIRVQVTNFRGISRADWMPEPGVSLLVGPNGSGKTTLLEVPALLRDAIERGTQSAIDEHGGSGTLVNLNAAKAEYAEIETTIGDLGWRLQLRPRGGELGIAHRITLGAEQFVSNSNWPMHVTFPARSSVSIVNAWSTESAWPTGVGSSLADRVVVEPMGDKPSPEMKLVAEQCLDKVSPLLVPLLGYRMHGGYLVRVLRVNGSKTSSDMELDRDGTNAFSVLRNWLGARATRPRWDFVVEGLKAAFPDLFDELEFESAGQTVAARIFAPRTRQSIGAYFAPDGLLTAILHLTAVASAPPGGALSIDEFENSLHPYAIRALLDHIRGWTSKQQISVTLATHSPVLINQFKDEPSRLLVMDPKADIMPVSVDKMRDPEWLSHFSLGDLYASGEFGAQAAR